MSSKNRPAFPDKSGNRPKRDTVESRKRNRVILKSVLACVLAVDSLLVLLLGYLVFLHVPYFNLQQVDVTGNSRLSRAEVIEASQIESGINLITVDLGIIAERLKRHPWIRSASVYRRFPAQLIVEIEERTPRAILSADKLYYVDDQAEIFTRLLPGDPVDFPLITGVTPDQLNTDGPEIWELIRSGLNLLDLMERTGSDLELSEVSEIRVDPDDGLTLHTRSGRIVILGKGKFEQKMQNYGRLRKFLTQTGEWHNARIINLDFEDRALVRSADRARLQG